MLKKSKNYFLEHKKLIIFIIVLVATGSYYAYTKITSIDGETRYVFGTAKKGMLIMSVSGTGQVTPVSQIDLKPKASGDITYLNAVAGTKVAAGAIIARLDVKNVSASIRDANVGLESARLSYDKYISQNSDEKLSANLVKAYDAGYASVNSALLDIPIILNNLEDLNSRDILSQNSVRVTGGSKGLDYLSKSESKFYLAQDAVKLLVKNYQGLERKSSDQTIQRALSETYKTTKLLSDAIKAKKDFVDYLYDESERSSSYVSIQTSLGQYSATINSHMSSVLSGITNIQDSTSAFNDTALGIKSSEISIKERQNSLRDAQDKLEDYIVRAPFAGLIAKSDAKIGDSASPSTVVATLITKQKIAEISLNEVDVAKVVIGQKSTLTFDAIPDLTISGEVSEVDLVGTVSQGVVTYNIKISFDTQDDRVKPGMSVSSSIITDTKADVILVPNGAIKGKNSSSYVEVSDELVTNETGTTTQKGILLTQPPINKNVEVGLSNDEFTEILSGINDGDRIIVRTISASSATTAKTSASPVRMPGLGGH